MGRVVLVTHFLLLDAERTDEYLARPDGIKLAICLIPHEAVGKHNADDEPDEK